MANRHFLSRQRKPKSVSRPVFVVGPPRCGSTLLFQALTGAVFFSYFTNEMMRYPHCVPLFVFHRRPLLGPPYSFGSEYGRTVGRRAPHEAWPFWRRFYPRGEDDYVERHGLSTAQSAEIIASIAFIEAFYDAPFLVKNLESVLRLRSLQELFPGAIYIVVKRDLRAVVSSILRGRVRLVGGRDYWMGMRPRGWRSLTDEPPHVQAVRQALAAYEAFYRDVRTRRYLEIYYEDFCEAPAAALEEVAVFLDAHGVVTRRRDLRLPRRFECRREFGMEAEPLEHVTRICRESAVFQEHLEFKMTRRGER